MVVLGKSQILRVFFLRNKDPVKSEIQVPINLYKTSPGRRRPRRPRFLNSVILSRDSWFLSQLLAHQSRSPWTKTSKSATFIRTGIRDSKIQDGEDINVLRSPDLYSKQYRQSC